MTRMFVRHEFEDHARWRPALAGSARLKQVMQGAGVTSAPQIWSVDEA